MKTRSILLGLLVSAAAASSAQTFNPEHKYVVDAKDAYTMKMTMTSTMGEIGVTMDMTQTVKKVYDNGDADIETAISNMSVVVGGNPMPAGNRPMPAQMMKVDKFGKPLSNSQPGGRNPMGAMRFDSYFGDKPLEVGKTYTFEQKDEKNPKNHTKGTAKLISIENGRANLEVSADSYTENSEKPMHMDGTVSVDASNGKMMKFHGKMKDMPGAGAGISNAEFTIEHK